MSDWIAAAGGSTGSDRLELQGWDLRIADALKVRAIAPLACKSDTIDCWLLAELARRGPLRKNGPAYLCWALSESAHAGLRWQQPDQDLAERMRARPGRKRGTTIAVIEVARRQTQALWQMLTNDQSFAPAGAALRLAARRPEEKLRYRSKALSTNHRKTVPEKDEHDSPPPDHRPSFIESETVRREGQTRPAPK